MILVLGFILESQGVQYLKLDLLYIQGYLPLQVASVFTGGGVWSFKQITEQGDSQTGSSKNRDTLRAKYEEACIALTRASSVAWCSIVL